MTVDNQRVKFIIEESSAVSDLISSCLVEEVDVVMLCFSIPSPPTLVSAVQTWVPHLLQVPLLLVGCQGDLRTDRNILSSLIRQGLTPVTANQAMFFARQIEAVMYVETKAILSNKSAISAFELAAKTRLGLFSRQSSMMSSSSSITSPLIKQRSRSSCRETSRSKSDQNPDFWQRFKSPSSSRRSRTKSPVSVTFSSLRLREGNSRSKSSTRSDTNSVISVSTKRDKTPKMSRRLSGQEQAEKVVVIKCMRLNREKDYEEIEIELPEAVFDNLEEEEEEEQVEKIKSDDEIKNRWSTKLKGLFAKSG